MSKPIRNLGTGETFPSLSEAAQSIGVRLGSLGNSIRRGQRCGGYRWEYADDLRKVLLCVETGQTYQTVRSAAAAHHMDVSSIYLAMQEGRPTCGLTFQWVDNPAQGGKP